MSARHQFQDMRRWRQTTTSNPKYRSHCCQNRSMRPRRILAADRFVVLDNRNDVRGSDGLLVIAARAFDDGLSSNGVGLGVGEDLDANAASTPPSKYFHGGRHHKPKRNTCDVGQTDFIFESTAPISCQSGCRPHCEIERRSAARRGAFAGSRCATKVL